MNNNEQSLMQKTYDAIIHELNICTDEAAHISDIACAKEEIYKILERYHSHYEKEMKSSNELLRSAYQIALRKGADTNWEAWLVQLGKELERQHKVMFPPLDELIEKPI